MLDGDIFDLRKFGTKRQNSISGLSSGAFMTVQLHVAHSASFVGAGIIAGGPYRAAETYAGVAFTKPTACILNSLYIAMTPLTKATAPDVSKLIAMAQGTEDIDPLEHMAAQRLYIFTGTEDLVVNQHGVRATQAFYAGLGVPEANIRFVDDVPAGHSIITMNPEDSPLAANQPPYINCGPFIQSHDILNHIYPGLKPPADRAVGELRRFEQEAYCDHAPDEASMARFGYVYLPSGVLAGEEALGVHIVLHGCKQGYSYTNYVNGLADSQNQPPYGLRYVTATGYLEMAEANNLILLFPQVEGRDDNFVQNPDGCWDWWGYSSQDETKPDYYSRSATQIRAVHRMLEALSA